MLYDQDLGAVMRGGMRAATALLAHQKQIPGLDLQQWLEFFQKCHSEFSKRDLTASLLFSKEERLNINHAAGLISHRAMQCGVFDTQMDMYDPTLSDTDLFFHTPDFSLTWITSSTGFPQSDIDASPAYQKQENIEEQQCCAKGCCAIA